MRCLGNEQQTILDSLYFGLGTPTGSVSPEEWQNFLAEVVTPRFPSGLTVAAASGQWKNANQQIEHEDSRVVQIVHPQTPADEERIRAIIAEYQRRFHQEAVMRVRGAACVSF